MSLIYLVEITGGNAIGGGGLTTFYFSTGNGYTTGPQESPANTYYEPRVTQAGLYEKSCFGGAKTAGIAPVGYGTIELANKDGALDSLRSYAFDGKDLIVRSGDSAAPKSAFTIVFAGTVDQLSYSGDTCSVRMRDVLQNLDVPLQPLKFAGDNVLPDGLEGTADDLKGKPKPVCFGWVYNVRPPQVNTTRFIYQVHYKDFAYWQAGDLVVYDQRSPITAGSEKTYAQMGAGATLLAFTVNTATDVVTTAAHGYTSGDGVSVLSTGGTLPAPLLDSVPYFVRVLSATTFTLHPTKADALANTNIVNLTTAGSGALDVSNNRTALGCFDWCNDTDHGVFFRLGSKPIGEVTCDAINPLSNYGSRQALPDGLVSLLIATAITSPMLHLYDGFNPTWDPNAQAYTTGGVYIDEETTVLQALEPVLAGGGYFIEGASNGTAVGSIAMGQVGHHSTSALSIAERDCINEPELVVSDDTDRGIPAWRVSVRYKRNHTPMSASQIADSVSTADAAFVAQEWRTSIAENAGVKVSYQNAPEIIRETTITDQAEADAEATRQGMVYQFRHDLLRVAIRDTKADAVRLGYKVTLTHRRFGCSAGAAFWVLGISMNRKEQTATLLLWR